jgi:hypothetical protein
MHCVYITKCVVSYIHEFKFQHLSTVARTRTLNMHYWTSPDFYGGPLHYTIIFLTHMFNQQQKVVNICAHHILVKDILVML